jgi:hypothetical protein
MAASDSLPVTVDQRRGVRRRRVQGSEWQVIMAAPTPQQMITACQQAVRYGQQSVRPGHATCDCDTDEGSDVEVFSAPHLSPGIAAPGDWYEVGILYGGDPQTALGVYLNAHSGFVKLEQPLLDVLASPSIDQWRQGWSADGERTDDDRADDDGWNPWL